MLIVMKTQLTLKFSIGVKDSLIVVGRGGNTPCICFDLLIGEKYIFLKF